MASVIGDTTCAIHPDRNAGARCPQCEQFYCSECITEHEGRLICAACLHAPEEVEPDARNGFRKVAGLFSVVLQLSLAIFFCWLIFYVFAQTLGDMPDDFHDGTIWE